ncbi:hypothetical protein [Streptomyces sp. NPDC002889]|uniref:hypothetical protein n=1 Tax=Streptomyces sp. NPDC002889 TaxID=3364669 RepID=UPI0036D09B84
MSSLPPPGPPTGPLASLPAPGPGRRPPRRTRALIIGGVLAAVVLALAVVLVTLLRGGGGNGGAESGSDSVSPSPVDSAAARAAARDLAARVALTTTDWGPGFVESDRYETSPVPESVVLETCEWSTRASRAGTLASISRTVYNEEFTLSATSEVRVYADEAAAEQYVADAREAIHRCPDQHQGNARWTGVREAAPPKVPGFEELVSEEGKQVVADDGTKTNFVYVLLTGRANERVLTASASGDAKQTDRIREQAADGLRTMRQRLTQQAAAAAGR